MLARVSRVSAWFVIPVWIVAVVVRLVVAPTNGYSGDILHYQTWAVGEERMQFGAADERPGACNYPPLYPIVLRCLAAGDRAGFLPVDLKQPVTDVTVPTARGVLLVMKMPAMLADLWTIGLLAAIGRTVCAPMRGLMASALYAVSPAIIYDSAVWGQTDTILVALLVWAVLAALRDQPGRLGVAMTLAVLMKLQAAPALAPIAAAMVVQRQDMRGPRWSRFVVGVGGTLVGVAVASFVCGVQGQWVRGVVSAVGYFPVSSLGAMNLWWLFDGMVSDQAEVIAGLSRRTCGVILFGVAAAVILRRWLKCGCPRDALPATMAAMAMAFFVLPTEIHERYSIPVVGLLTAASVFDVRAIWVSVFLSITVTLNLAYELPLFVPGWPEVTRVINWIAWISMEHVRTLIAIIHVGFLGVLVVLADGRRSFDRTAGAVRARREGGMEFERGEGTSLRA